MKEGDTFHVHKGLPEDPPRKAHVVAIVDNDYVVFKWYGLRRQWWHYEIRHIDLLEIEIERGLI